MTDDEARKVAQHCVDAWPSGPKAYIWRELVIDLDYGTAVGAYKTLARDAVRTPTTGAFMAHYRALKPTPAGHAAVHWTGNEIGLGEHLERIGRRAAQGDQAAADELAVWERSFSKQAPT